MFTKRAASERGHNNFGWLDTYHTFSFGDYYNPAQMGFRALRVINEDRVQAGGGFPMHGHKDMEIVSYVLEGRVEHRDSAGNHGIIGPGEIQRISAGSGIRHSEFNPSKDEAVHFYQIWLEPNAKGLKPGYEQRDIGRAGQRLLIASPDGRDGSATINCEATIEAVKLKAGEVFVQELKANRHAWVQVMGGHLNAGSLDLSAGDGLAISAETRFELKSMDDSEVLIFDLD